MPSLIGSVFAKTSRTYSHLYSDTRKTQTFIMSDSLSQIIIPLGKNKGRVPFQLTPLATPGCSRPLAASSTHHVFHIWTLSNVFLPQFLNQSPALSHIR